MIYNELDDFFNLNTVNTGLVNATNAITAASSSLTNCFSSDSPIAKDAVNIALYLSPMHCSHFQNSKSKLCFLAISSSLSLNSMEASSQLY